MKNHLIKSDILFKKEIGISLNSKKVTGIEEYFEIIISTLDEETRKLLKKEKL